MRLFVRMWHFYTLSVSRIFSVSRLLLKMKIDKITSDLYSVFWRWSLGSRTIIPWCWWWSRWLPSWWTLPWWRWLSRGWRSSSYLSSLATNLYSVFWRWSLGSRTIIVWCRWWSRWWTSWWTLPWWMWSSRGWRSSSYISDLTTNLYSVFLRWSLGSGIIITWCWWWSRWWPSWWTLPWWRWSSRGWRSSSYLSNLATNLYSGFFCDDHWVQGQW